MKHNNFRNALPDRLADRDARDYSRRLGNNLSRQEGVRHMNGLMLKKAGKKRRGVLWQVVSYENANSHPFSYKCELGESQITPARVEKRKNTYIEWVEVNSPDSPSAMKSGELEPPNSPSAPKTDKISSNIPQSSTMANKPASVNNHHAERGGFSPPDITTEAHHPVGASLRAHSSMPQSSVVFCGFL